MDCANSEVNLRALKTHERSEYECTGEIHYSRGLVDLKNIYKEKKEKKKKGGGGERVGRGEEEVRRDDRQKQLT